MNVPLSKVVFLKGRERLPQGRFGNASLGERDSDSKIHEISIVSGHLSPFKEREHYRVLIG